VYINARCMLQTEDDQRVIVVGGLPVYYYYCAADAVAETYAMVVLVESSAVHSLCELLDQTATVFPSSRLRVRFAVRPPPSIGLAFPGTPTHRRTSPEAQAPERTKTGHFQKGLCQEV